MSLNAVTTAIHALQTAVNAAAGARRVGKGATQEIVTQLQAGHGAVRLMGVGIRPLLVSYNPMLVR